MFHSFPSNNFFFWQQHLRPNSISGGQKLAIYSFSCFYQEISVWPSQGARYDNGERASLSDRCQEVVAEVDTRHLVPQTKTNMATLRRGPTPLRSIVIGRDRIVIDLDGSVIGPGNAVTHTSPRGSLLTSSLKRLHELHETCH